MLSLGAFAFAAPGMLALLLALPLIYWLLRMIPPLPRLVRFPAIRLLIGLEPTEQTPMKMPWWLLLLRLLLATALILAVARPLLNPQADLPGKGPLLLVIDDGCSSAPGWTARLRRFDGMQVLLPDQATTPLLLLPPSAEGRDLKVQALRPVADGPRKVAVQAGDDQGRTVARFDIDFAANATKGEGTLQAPVSMRHPLPPLDIYPPGAHPPPH